MQGYKAKTKEELEEFFKTRKVGSFCETSELLILEQMKSEGKLIRADSIVGDKINATYTYCVPSQDTDEIRGIILCSHCY